MSEAKQEETKGEAQTDAQQDGNAAEQDQSRQQKAAREAAKKGKKQKEAKPAAVSVRRLHWYEFLGFLGSLVLAGSLFLPWFATDCESRAAAREASRIAPGGDCNPNSVYNGRFDVLTAFETFKYLDWILVGICVVPFILAYIIIRAHTLSWKPGEVTMILGMCAVALILLNGIILGKPGDTVDMKFKIGWLIGLIGASILMTAGTLRQALHADAAKPPGVM